ncbi:Uncharacterised protein [Rothia kristinae]|nr:Uncharacterised protein [Rothia kristinae]
MTSCTRAVSRSDSLCRRRVKWRTASSSPAAESMASASRRTAPTGVFSSWETLATKSVRIAWARVISVRSSASSRMYSSATGAMRTLRMSTERPVAPREISTVRSTMTPLRRTWRISSTSSSCTISCPRTRP